MDNLILVATQVGVLFLLMAVGIACRRMRYLDDRVVKGLVDILVVVVTPCLVVNAFQRPFSPDMLKGLGFVAFAAVAGHVAAILLVYALLHHRDAARRNVLRVAAVFSNAGFMGIPLDQALLGDLGVFYGVIYIGIFNVFIWSWGYGTISGGGEKGAVSRTEKLRRIAVNPGTIGLALGLPLFFTSTTLPAVLHDSCRFIADLNTPLAMFVIGYYLAGAKFGAIVKVKEAYFSAAFRLVGYPLMMIGFLLLARNFMALDRTMMLALVVSASAPVAALTSMIAARCGSDVDLSVGLVSGTTLLSIVTMPPVIALAMEIL